MSKKTYWFFYMDRGFYNWENNWFARSSIILTETERTIFLWQSVSIAVMRLVPARHVSGVIHLLVVISSKKNCNSIFVSRNFSIEKCLIWFPTVPKCVKSKFSGKWTKAIFGAYIFKRHHHLLHKLFIYVCPRSGINAQI